MIDQKNISLIILNYNSFMDTCMCVDQLLSFEDDFHIVIVDNMSTDDSYQKLKETYANQNVDILQTGSNGGYSKGNNYGMRFAIEKYGSEVVGILNPDVVIPNATVINKMYDALFLEEKFAIAGACAKDINDKFDINASAWNLPTSKSLIRNYLLFAKNAKPPLVMEKYNDCVAKVDCVVGCFFLAKSAVMQEIGYLDEGVFLYNEENLLGHAMKEYGYSEIIVLDQYYNHNHKTSRKKTTLKKKLETQKYPFESRCYLCRKYYGAKGIYGLKVAYMINKLQIVLGYIRHSV